MLIFYNMLTQYLICKLVGGLAAKCCFKDTWFTFDLQWLPKPENSTRGLVEIGFSFT